MRSLQLALISGLLIFSPLLDGGTTHLAVMGIRLLVLALCGVFLMAAVVTGTAAWPSLPIGVPLLILSGLAVLSTAWSPYLHQSAQWMVVLLTYAVFLYLVVSALCQWNDAVKVLGVVVGMGLVESVWALLQTSWLGLERPTGTFFNPNFLANYVATVLMIVLGSLCYAIRRRQDWRGGRAMLLGGTVTILVLTLVVTASRAGTLSALGGLACVLAARFGRKALVALLIVMVLAISVPNPIRDRAMAEHRDNPFAYTRWHIWRSSAQMMAAYPGGIGLGLYQYVYPRFAAPVDGKVARYGALAQTAHNEYVQLGVELGLGSLVFVGWGMVLVAREVGWALRRRLRRWQRGIVVGVSGALVAILMHAALDSNLHAPAIALVCVVCLGIVFSIRRFADDGRRTHLLPTKPRWLWASATLLAGVLLAAGIVRVGVAWSFHEAGSAALANHDVDVAIAQFRAAIEMDPYKAAYHRALADAYFEVFQKTHDRRTAQLVLAELQRAIELNPLDGRPFGFWGHVRSVSALSPQLAADRKAAQLAWLEAASAYEAAVQLEPFNPFYRMALGQAYRAVGDRERAERSVRQAVEIEPNFLTGREWLVQFYLAAKRREEADHEYREILERQQRAAGLSTSSYEERLLRADVPALTELLRRGSPS